MSTPRAIRSYMRTRMADIARIMTERQAQIVEQFPYEHELPPPYYSIPHAQQAFWRRMGENPTYETGDQFIAALHEHYDRTMAQHRNEIDRRHAINTVDEYIESEIPAGMSRIEAARMHQAIREPAMARYDRGVGALTRDQLTTRALADAHLVMGNLPGYYHTTGALPSPLREPPPPDVDLPTFRADTDQRATGQIQAPQPYYAHHGQYRHHGTVTPTHEHPAGMNIASYYSSGARLRVNPDVDQREVFPNLVEFPDLQE